MTCCQAGMYVFGLLPVLVVVPSCDGTAALVRLVASFSVHCLAAVPTLPSRHDTIEPLGNCSWR
ncbi:hypothetical protein TYRP_019024 [Tyrophagus putrescentiae]|nr:hypothetical protein TYRP_019024 [Tyrophagus putrescentiae]